MTTPTSADTARKTPGIKHYLGIAISSGILALVAVLGAVTIAIPALSGATPLTVLTNSMVPTYSPGTLVVIKPVAATAIRAGDAITYQVKSDDPTLITHRVQSITSTSDGTRSFVTKGDNNPSADTTPVVPEQVKGRVWYSIPYVGWVANAMNGPMRGLYVPLIGGALFLYVGYNIASGLSKAAEKRKAHTTA